MKRRRHSWIVAALLCVVTFCWQAEGVVLTSSQACDPNVLSGTVRVGDGQLLDFYKLGALTLLANTCDYAWWYGCSPTSTGMMMGYYDRNGYSSLTYTNLVPGGVAESETYVGPPTGSAALGNNAIASARHISDFYRGGYGAFGDDVAGAPTGPLNCLADFMGTSQDAAGNSNGSTTFYFWTDGSPFTASDALLLPGWGYPIDTSGMYGIGEYLQYAGYNYTTLYNQYIDALGLPQGFTFEQYRAEIDAGRPVLIQVENHTMLGYGYDDAVAPTVYLYDTWTPGPHTMTWGGSYSNLGHYGVTVVNITGGDAEVIPEPTTLALLGAALVAVARRRRRS